MTVKTRHFWRVFLLYVKPNLLQWSLTKRVRFLGIVKAQNKIKKNKWRAKYKQLMAEHARQMAFPPVWSVEPHMDRDDFRLYIRNELKKDSIPLIVKEHENWIFEGDNKHADQVIAYIRTVLDRLSQATHGRDHPPIRIAIADVDGPYAAMLTDIVVCVNNKTI
jgi:hypothetical protein